MITTKDRRETLGRERGRLAKALKRPFPLYARDKRIIVDALEALVLLDLKTKGDEQNADKPRKQ